jgi:hypothetical protein
MYVKTARLVVHSSALSKCIAMLKTNAVMRENSAKVKLA